MAVDEAFDCRLLKRQDSEDTDLVTDTGGTLLLSKLSVLVIFLR